MDFWHIYCFVSLSNPVNYMIANRLRTLLFAFIFTILLLPLVNDQLHLITTSGLLGSFTLAPDVEFMIRYPGTFAGTGNAPCANG